MEENLSFGTGPLSEATPELVSQDRRAGGESRQASEHRQILRSAQMGAGSNAGPHFSMRATLFLIIARPGRAADPRGALALPRDASNVPDLSGRVYALVGGCRVDYLRMEPLRAIGGAGSPP